METRTTPPTRPSSSSIEATLLARLGLPANASSQDVEAAHDALVEFLEGAPGDLRDWAGQQIGLIDEAFARVSDSTMDRSALTGNEVADVNVELVGRPSGATGNRLMRRVAIGAAAIVGVVVIAIAGFNLNGGTGVPPMSGTPAPEAGASAGVDQAQVADLMQKIQADPRDVGSLQSLADVYYQAGDYTTAGTFLDKALAVDPKNLIARLALGAVQFNLGNADEAEKQWRAVLAVDAKNVEAHYDLGFLYLSESPPDMAKVKVEWNAVIEIDPSSDVAKTVATHLASLEGSPAPSASGAPASPSASPAPSASPSPSGG
jgi:tetratricopeptide (TPR) repeat protein